MASKVPFFEPWITDEDKKAVVEALESRWLTGGPSAARFEDRFASYIGVKHAISVNSCTAALHLALKCLKIKTGDEVAIPVLTFAATANAPLFCGAKPVFIDVDEKTSTISPRGILEKVTRKTKAIIAVHYAGQPCDMKEISEIAEDHNLFIVEDCAHALGAYYLDKKAGNTIGCFSFYPTKVITTAEGGMITTNDDSIAKKARLLRSHAITKEALEREQLDTWIYDIVDLGYNFRLNEVQAALGISQLQRVDEINRRRINAAQLYTKKLRKIEGIIPPFEAQDRTHIYHLYVIRVLENNFGLTRNELFKYLSSRDIGVSVHYRPLHLLTFYKKLLKYNTGDFPIAEHLYEEILSLPLFPTITKSQIEYVVKTIEDARI